MLVYDASAVARLEKAYSAPQIAEQRRRLREIIAPRPGETGLDVGCGVAFLACEMAREVAPGGRIAALDKSAQAVEASKVRVAKEGLQEAVTVEAGDAANLPFPDESFDFAVAAQVYCYVPDVERAIGEAARVLRKGGRLVVLDSDWEMCVWESSDPVLARRIIDARGAAQFAHAHLPRRLHHLMLKTGLTLASAQTFSILETAYSPDSFSVGIIPSMREAAHKHGIPPEDVARWTDDLASRQSPGEWFFCLNRFVFTARK